MDEAVQERGREGEQATGHGHGAHARSGYHEHVLSDAQYAVLGWSVAGYLAMFAIFVLVLQKFTKTPKAERKQRRAARRARWNKKCKTGCR
jgi:hypothetical protein